MKSEFTSRELLIGGISIYYPPEDRNIILSPLEIISMKHIGTILDLDAEQVKELIAKAHRMAELNLTKGV